MRKLLLRLDGQRTMAKIALRRSQQTLKEVKSRNKDVDEVVSTSKMLRDKNHFQETIKALMQWSS